MTDDLIDRLRNPVTPTIYTLDCAAMRDAADEIERLEADTKEVNAARIYLREKEGLLRELHEVTKQRDDLLTALINHQDQTRPIQQTINAIARVKEGK
ncbi:MAG: hypothetical protein ABFC42_10250 [Sulfuricella sp.]